MMDRQGSAKRTFFKTAIVWRNVGYMSALHLGAVYALCLLPSIRIWTALWALLLYQFSALGITAGAHRLWAHRSYKAKGPLRVILMIFNSIAGQNNVFEWARDHRVHHKFSETDADPHNSKRGFFFSHVGWLLTKKHPDVIEKGQKIDLSDLLADPVVVFQKRYYKWLMFLFNIILPTIIPVFWSETLWNAYFVPFLLRYVVSLNVTWTVNSLAHMWGYRPYDQHIRPAENALVAFGALGEGFHNYHHTFPFDYRTSEFGFRLNPTTWFIDAFSKLGWVYDKKVASRQMIQQRKYKTGSLKGQRAE